MLCMHPAERIIWENITFTLVREYHFILLSIKTFRWMIFNAPKLLMICMFYMFHEKHSLQFSSVHSLTHVWFFATLWTAACQASLSIMNSQNLLKLMSIDLVMPCNHLILCHPLLLLSILPRIRIFSIESTFHIRWPKYWSFSFNIRPSNEYSGLISFRVDWLDLLAVQGTLESSPTPQFKSINSSVLSFLYSPTLISIHDHWKNHSLD